MNIRFPKIETAYFPLEGGLDLQTPAISLSPGRAFDAQNYEPEISGGYRRVDGYERFDGRPSPTESATYVQFHATLTNFAAFGSTIRGGLTGTEGTLVAGEQLTGGDWKVVVSGVNHNTGSFFVGEPVLVVTINDGVEVLTNIGVVSQDSSEDPDQENHADYMYLSAEQYRAEIGPVPGNGPIRGVFSLDGDVYAFRDDDTLQKLYKATADGWVEIIYGKYLPYDQGAIKINAGDVITNGAGASATVGLVANRIGIWDISTPTAEGILILQFGSLVGNWADNDNITVGATIKAKATGPSADITRLAGGKLELVKHNFAGRVGNQVIYGTDGVNLAFEFNGPYFVPIRTGITPESADHPLHCAVHSNYLFVSVGNSIMHPGVDNPYSFGSFGTAEYNVGAHVTGFLSITGGNTGPVMAVFTEKSVKMMYGSGVGNFRLQNAVTDIGYGAYTIQPIGPTAFGLTARGLQTLNATQTFGDFAFSSISAQLQPIINLHRGQETCSVVLKNKNQYRVYYGDEEGTCIAVGLTGDKVTGLLPLKYGRPVRCIWTDTFNGIERTFFGSDDGYVYEDNKGTSFDGAEIEAWVRLSFNHLKSPHMRKRFRRAVLEAKVDEFCKVNFSYDLGYGNPDVQPPPLRDDTALVGGNGGYWDQFTFDEFVWDSQTVIAPSFSLEGTEKNVSMVFHSKRKQDASHTLQGIVMLYTQRRNER